MTPSTPDQRLSALNITLPPLKSPVANYVPYRIAGALIYISGQLPFDPAGSGQCLRGKVGEALSVEEGQKAAYQCAIQILAQLKGALGTLDRVQQCVQLTVFVNAPPEFSAHPQVANGASDLMVAVFGVAGQHARAAVGVGSLPLGAAVEVAAIFELGAA